MASFPLKVVCGDHSIVSGTEETCMPFEEGHNFGVYGKTKFLAEKMILEANGISKHSFFTEM